IVKKRRREFHALRSHHLVHARVERVAAFRFQIRIPRKARIRLERLREVRLFDSESVRSAQPRLAPESAAAESRQIRQPCPWHESRAETRVVFRAASGNRRQPSPELIMRFEISSLIISTLVWSGRRSVFHFVVVAKRN